MVSEDRQRIIEANRSLRLIKNELESLLEKGVLSEDAFDSINNLLPTESSISGARRGGGAPVPPAPGASTTTTATRAPAVSAGIANRLNNLHMDDHADSPPSYTQSTNGGPPPLPGRKQAAAAPPPPPPPSKPIIAHAKALYPYAATDARDCSFERDDRLAVYEYMNADWWMGKNLRTGQEGIFPKAYVEQEQQSWNSNEKGANNNDPYNSHVPPQTMANNSYDNNNNNNQEGGGGGSKMGETGKKFGKKLGNAAIFGAGATIGSNIVNSIF